MPSWLCLQSLVARRTEACRKPGRFSRSADSQGASVPATQDDLKHVAPVERVVCVGADQGIGREPV